MTNKRLKFHAGAVLLWFLSFVAAGTFSASIHAQVLQPICSASNVENAQIVDSGQGHETFVSHGMHCPLCTGVGMLPQLQVTAFKAVIPSGFIWFVYPEPKVATVLATPPPGRGPPSLFES